MTGRWLLGSFLAFLAAWGVRADGPPKVSGSYMASGEMVQSLEDTPNIQLQIAFEESFDQRRNMAAFTVWLMGQNLTFVENFNTSQTFRFNGTDCTLETVQDWIETQSPPSLMAYEDTSGTVRFSLKQLFALDDKYLKESDVEDTFRGIPARKWMYEIKGQDPAAKKTHILNVYAYWSDGSWRTSNSDQATPLGFVVTRMNFTAGKPGVKLHEQFINVFSFVTDAVDHMMFQPIQGVECEQRKQTLPFPDVNKFAALSVHSEVVFPDNLEIRYLDTWFDFKNKILRMDSERIQDEVPLFEEKMLKFQSEIVVGPMGVVFRKGNTKGVWSCEVIPIEKFEFDVQNLLNIKLPPAQWEMAKVFGRNETTYVYIGKTFRRDIPCHMFQGMRTDWPEPSAKVKSLWEWCFSENMTLKDDIITFRNGEYGLVHAQVKILESGNQIFYPGLRFIHHFYDVNRKEPDVMQASSFDISKCFVESERRDLQFVVDWMLTDDNVHLIENATSDVTFLQKWKSAIYRNGGEEPYTLRVTKVRATVVDKKLYVKFSLLDPHKGLPKDIRSKQKSNFDMEQAIRKNINDGKMFVSYLPSADSKMLKLVVEAHTLDKQVKGDFEPHVTPSVGPDPTKTTKKGHTFNLRTESDEDTKTPPDQRKTTKMTTHTEKPRSTTPGTTFETSTGTGTQVTPTGRQKKEGGVKSSGHGPGTVATVSVAMLLIGISSGAAGIFVRYNGMPKCGK